MTGPPGDDGDSLSPETVRLIDRVCDRFEAAWRAGRRPRLDDYLTGLGDADRRAALTELVPLDAEYRWAAGEAPTAAEYRDRFPELGDDRPAGPLVGGRYELLRLLASGGMGRVYLAADRRIDRPVALKTLAGAVGDPVAADRFHREALRWHGCGIRTSSPCTTPARTGGHRTW